MMRVRRCLNWTMLGLLLLPGANITLARPGTAESPRWAVIGVGLETPMSGFNPQRFQAFSKPRSPRSSLPLPRERERTFAEAGLRDEDLRGFDAVARDLLYLAAKNHSLQELAKRYPAIAISKLRALHEGVARLERQKRLP